ncbi:MAG: transglutaminase-like domain-containing protein [Alphaproteobacteria bacterium]
MVAEISPILAEAEQTLRRISSVGDDNFDIAEGALAYTVLSGRVTSLTAYRDHLKLLTEEVAAAAGPDPTTASLSTRISALNQVILNKHGYRGAVEDYDDIRNAELTCVIERRRGLPITLGILYIHTARAQGWNIQGLAFPGHFLVRISSLTERVILDPFADGRRREAADLRELLKVIVDANEELTPAHYAPVPDRDVLLRLQSNIKVRLLQAGRYADALKTVEHMQLISPTSSALIKEMAILNRMTGNIRRAIELFETYLMRIPAGPERAQITLVLHELRDSLN